MSRFQIQTNHAGAPQLCRIVSGRGDAANCREIIATGDELQEILTLLTNNEGNDMSTAENVKRIIKEQLGCHPDQIVPEARIIDDLGCDSLDTVELVMAFEEEYNIEIADEDAEKCATVGDVIDYFERRLGKEAQ